MINFKYFDIYIGIPNNLTINKDKFCFFTEVNIQKLDQFKSQNKSKYIDNKFVYFNGLPIKNLNNKYYWHRFNDPRLDGLEPTKKLLVEFPNIKVISKDIINGLSLKNNLGYLPTLKNNAKINLIITQGEISEIFESLGSWKQNIVSIKFLGKSQEYIHNNNEIQSYLEFTGFQKSESENYQEFKYIKILPKNNNSFKKYDFVSDIKPRNKNILNPRLNCLSKEADQALKMGNENVYDAISFYLNAVFEEKLETNFPSNNIQVLGSGAEGVCFLINNKVIKVYKDKYFYQKNKLDNNHEPEFLNKHKNDFFPDLKSFGKSYMEMDYLGLPIGEGFNNLKGPKYSIFLKEDIILNALKWLNDLNEFLIRQNIVHRDIALSNILYNEVENRFTLIDFSHARSLEINGNEFKKISKVPDKWENANLGFNSDGLVDDSKAINTISRFLVYKLIYDYLNKIKAKNTNILKQIAQFLNDKEIFFPNKFSSKKENLVKFIIKDSNSLKYKLDYCFISAEFSILGILLSKFSKNGFLITPNKFIFRIYEGLRIIKKIKNIKVINNIFTKNIYEKFNSNYDFFIISDLNYWINFKCIDSRFEKFISNIKTKSTLIYLDIKIEKYDKNDYKKFIIDYFSNFGYICKEINNKYIGISDDNYLLIKCTLNL